MIRYFFKLFIQRNFKRNGFHTLINILGLTIGLTAFILFILFIRGLQDYDKFNKNYNNIYRIVCEQKDSRGDFGGTPAQLGAYLADRVPEIKQYVRIDELGDVVITKDQEKFFESNLLFADNSFFEIFSFQIVKGNKTKPLEDINSVAISEKMALKYFGNDDPIGKLLKIGKNQQEFKVTAVIQDCPEKSSIKYDFITSFEIMAKRSNWGMFNYSTYLLLNNADQKAAEQKLKTCAVDRGGDVLMQLNFLRLQPLKNMRFEMVRGNTFNTVDRKYIYIFLSASLFILLLAIINYTNLASAISLKRSKEVALKKIMGCHKNQIISEFLAESITIACLALFASFILVEISRQYFGVLINEDIQLVYSYIPFFVLLAILVGILAGIYPSIYGSRYDIQGLLKESIYKGKKAKIFRNFLVVIQFGITSFLLISSLIFSKQLNFILNRDLGFDPNNIIEVKVHWDGIKLKELKDELMGFSAVVNVTTSTFTAGEDGWNQTAHWEGMTEESQINMFVIEADRDFASTLGITYLEQLNDFENLSFTGKSYYLINESAKKYIGWSESLNKFFSIYSVDEEGYIAGVLRDFNFRSLRHQSSPSAILLSKDPVPVNMHIKIKPGYEVDLISFLEKKWQQLAPVNAPLIITNLNQEFQQLYSTEKKTRTIIMIFSVVAIIISMLGLFGMATFITIQRTKEIGIRKANGANIRDVITMLVVEFVKWVIYALLLAIPIAYIYLKAWLNNFSYKTNLSWWIFALASALTLIIAFLSVIIQSYRASLKNPIESLRYE